MYSERGKENPRENPRKRKEMKKIREFFYWNTLPFIFTIIITIICFGLGGLIIATIWMMSTASLVFNICCTAVVGCVFIGLYVLVMIAVWD